MLNLRYNIPISGDTMKRILNCSGLSDALATVESDVSLALRVLYTVNSMQFHYEEEKEEISYYHNCLDVANNSCIREFHGRHTPIIPLKKALLTLSVDRLKTIVVSSDIHPPEDRIFYSVNRHSYLLARFIEFLFEIYPFTIKDHMETLKTGAFLHDAGKLVLYSLSPTYRELHGYTSPLWSSVERRIYGVDHREAGYHLLKQMGMPESISCMARYHSGNINYQYLQERHAPEDVILIAVFRAIHNIFTCHAGMIHGEEMYILSKATEGELNSIRLLQLSLIDFYRSRTNILDFFQPS